MKKHLIVFNYTIEKNNPHPEYLGDNFHEVIRQHIGADEYDDFTVINMSQSQETEGNMVNITVSMLIEHSIN